MELNESDHLLKYTFVTAPYGALRTAHGRKRPSSSPDIKSSYVRHFSTHQRREIQPASFCSTQATAALTFSFPLC
jgi:hypothetical protein